MAQFDPKSTFKLRSALQFKYLIVIETGLEILSLFFHPVNRNITITIEC